MEGFQREAADVMGPNRESDTDRGAKQEHEETTLFPEASLFETAVVVFFWRIHADITSVLTLFYCFYYVFFQPS